MRRFPRQSLFFRTALFITALVVIMWLLNDRDDSPIRKVTENRRPENLPIVVKSPEGRGETAVVAGIRVRSVKAHIAPIPGGALRRALMVTSLSIPENSQPGERALEPGDLLDEVNRRIVRSPEDLRRALAIAPVGAASIVRRIRAGEVEYVPLRLGGRGR